MKRFPTKTFTAKFTKTFAALSLITSVFAAEQWTNGDWKITRWGGENSDVIRCDIDSKGNLWYGTINGGLNYYDGSDTKAFTGGRRFPHLFETLYIDDQDTVFWSQDGEIVKVLNNQIVGLISKGAPKALGKSPNGTLFASWGDAPKTYNGSEFVTWPGSENHVQSALGNRFLFQNENSFFLFGNNQNVRFFTNSFSSLYAGDDFQFYDDSTVFVSTGNGGAAKLKIDITKEERINSTDYASLNAWLDGENHDPLKQFPLGTYNEDLFVGGIEMDANGLIWFGGNNMIATYNLKDYSWEAWTDIDTTNSEITQLIIRDEKLIGIAEGVFYEYLGSKHLPSSSEPSSSSDELSSSSEETNPNQTLVLPALFNLNAKRLSGVAKQTGTLKLQSYNSAGQVLGTATYSVSAGQAFDFAVPTSENIQGPWHLDVHMQVNGNQRKIATYNVMR